MALAIAERAGSAVEKRSTEPTEGTEKEQGLISLGIVDLTD